MKEISIPYINKIMLPNVSGHEDPADWQAAMPLSYTLDNIICKGEEIK